MKKVLWITDDQVNNREIFVENFKDNDLDLTLIEKFVYDDSFDIVVVDYGFVGDNDNAVSVLKKYFLEKIPILWSGGLGGSEQYVNDCKLMFVKDKWMHTIRSVRLNELIFDIHEEFERGV